MRIDRCNTLFSLLLLITLCSRADTPIEWTYSSTGSLYSPTLYPNAVAPGGVVVVSSDSVTLLDGKGAPVWSTKLDGICGTPACVADLNRDGTHEVLVGAESKELVCLNGEGTVSWRYPLLGSFSGFMIPVAADLLPTPGLEVLIGDDSGGLHCLDASGKPFWRFYGDRFRVGPPAIGDVTGDNQPEIIYSTDNGHIYCLSAQGTLVWFYHERAPFGRSGPILADLQGDGTVEVLITVSNTNNNPRLICLDGSTGRLNWRKDTVMQGYVSNAVADLDGDSILEIVTCDKANMVYCVRSDGTEQWRRKLYGRGVFWAPAIADIDGDGNLEMVVGVRGVGRAGHNFYVLSATGEIERELRLGGGANCAPAVGDIDGDGNLEIIVTAQEPNEVHCLSFGSLGKVAWSQLRYNSMMQGAYLPTCPKVSHLRTEEKPTNTINVRETTAYWGMNSWHITWAEPAKFGALLEVNVTPKRGVGETRIFPVQDSGTSADPVFKIANPGAHLVSFKLFNTASLLPAAAASERVKPEYPESCNLEELQGACNRANDAGERINADAQLLTEKLCALSAAQQSIKRSAARVAKVDFSQRDQLADRATGLRKQATELRQLATSLTDYWSRGGTSKLAMWQDENPWDGFDPHEVPASLNDDVAVTVRAYCNEYESAVLTLLNLSARAIEVRCSFARPSAGVPNSLPQLASHFTLHRVVQVPTHDNFMVADALPELDKSETMLLPPGEAHQLWLVVDTHGLDEGPYSLQLYITSLEPAPTDRTVTLNLDIWGVSLPEDVYAHINWTTVSQVNDSVLKDLLAHGTNVFCAAVPVHRFDVAGKEIEPPDWAVFDQQLKRLPARVRLLLSGPSPQIPAGVDQTSEAYRTAFAAALRTLVEHMNSNGWGCDRWALYPLDEPWLTGDEMIPYLRRFCEMVKTADPTVLIYADPAGHVTVEGVTPFADLIDIWQPELNILKRGGEPLRKCFRTMPGEIWAYEAPGNAKSLLPLGFYRAQPWMAWRCGLSGAGYWVYKSADLWYPVLGGEYGVVYPAGDDVVTSRRWEASRDGIEDYRALWLLREMAREARAAGYIAEADRADALLKEASDKVVGFQEQVDEILREVQPYDLDWQTLTAYREKIAETIVQLLNLIGVRSRKPTSR